MPSACAHLCSIYCNYNQSRPVWTGLVPWIKISETGGTSLPPVWSRFPSCRCDWETGMVLSPAFFGLKNETGPDFKSLLTEGVGLVGSSRELKRGCANWHIDSDTLVAVHLMVTDQETSPCLLPFDSSCLLITSFCSVSTAVHCCMLTHFPFYLYPNHSSSV